MLTPEKAYTIGLVTAELVTLGVPKRLLKPIGNWVRETARAEERKREQQKEQEASE